MNEKQLKSIEKRFSFELPNGIRQLLLSPPKLLEALIKEDHKENPGQIPIFLNHKMLLWVNESMRDPDDPDYCEFDPNDDSKLWPDHYLIIGSDVGGNFYCVSTKSKTSKVYFWYQGDTAFKKIADDARSFVKRIFRSYGEAAGMDCSSD